MYTLIKYLFDKIFALSLSIILLPFLVVVCFILTIHHSGNPLFMQTRVGLNEKLFKIIKFRTNNCQFNVYRHSCKKGFKFKFSRAVRAQNFKP